MKLLKYFKRNNTIESICKKYEINNYVINKDGDISVNDIVDISERNLTKIPIKFGNVSGDFFCSFNKINSLKNSPEKSEGLFSCDFNQITTLEHVPIYIGMELVCKSNKLTSIKHLPKYIHRYFDIRDNNMCTLHNIGFVGEEILTALNPVHNLVCLFNADAKLYIEYLELYNFQKPDSNIIYKVRFKEALKDLNINQLSNLNNYIYQ